MAGAVATSDSRQLVMWLAQWRSPSYSPLIFPLTAGYEGAYIILFSEKCSQKTSKSRKQFIGKDYLLHLSGMLAML